MPAITRELNILARCGNQFRGQRLQKIKLTAAQAPYILHICARPGLSQEELAKALHVNPSNAARQLSALSELGFVTREPKQGDRRQLAVYPTDKAIEVSTLVRSINAQWHDYLTKDMTEEEKSTLETLLEKMRQRAAVWDSERGEDQ
ncbi:MAG: MarR family transcriptional regulator [Clostridiales bacterium]|jgi:DNA-binding MarR family transcriptional regulator|nr:MarR family transcriptional regulator [Clostridiales bacterium]